MWMIIGGGALAALVGFVVWNGRRPKTFSYRGRSYTRHSDGSFTYIDGSSVDREELEGVQDHWDSTHDSSGSDSGSSDGGGGDGGGGGGD